jgi:Ca2+-transporting ATPase
LFYSLDSVQEFRQAVGEKSVSDLRFALKLDVRCGSSSTEQQQQAAVALIALLSAIYPQFSDWRELVKGQAHSEVQKCMSQHADFVKAEKMPEMGGLILAPQGNISILNYCRAKTAVYQFAVTGC